MTGTLASSFQCFIQWLIHLSVAVLDYTQNLGWRFLKSELDVKPRPNEIAQNKKEKAFVFLQTHTI